MAVYDSTKKKRNETIPATGVFTPNYGAAPAGGGGGGGGTGSTGVPAAAPRAPVAMPMPTGYGAGTALRGAVGDAANQSGVMTAKIASPYLQTAIAGANFIRGLTGAPSSPAPATPAAPPAAATPSRVPPAGTATAPGGAQPAGGGTPVARSVAPVLRPGDTNTFTGSDGVTRAVPGLLNTTAPAVNAAPAIAPALAMPTYNAAPAPSVASTFGLPVTDPRLAAADAGLQRPTVAVRGADATAEAYNSREDRDARNKLLSNIDDQLFRLNIGGGSSRGKRAAIADLAGVQAGLISNGERLARDAITSRAANDTTLANTGLEQAGANQRAALEQTGALDRTALEQSSATARSQAELNKPQFITAADGSLVRLTPSGEAAAVPLDGAPLKMPLAAKDSGQVTAKDYLGALTEQLKAEQTAVSPNADRIAQLQQQIAQYDPSQRAASGAASAPAGMKLVGTSGGKPVYEDANGKRYSY